MIFYFYLVIYINVLPQEKRQKDLILMEEALKQNYEIQSHTVAEANVRKQKLLDDIAQVCYIRFIS